MSLRACPDLPRVGPGIMAWEPHVPSAVLYVMGEGHWFWNLIWVQILTLPFSGCLTLGKFLHIPELRVPQLNGLKWGLLQRVDEGIH